MESMLYKCMKVHCMNTYPHICSREVLVLLKMIKYIIDARDGGIFFSK